MRVSNWNPQAYDGEIVGASMERLRKAANVVRDAARAKCKVFAGKLHGPYKKGKYAGQVWTARDTENLQKTIRTVEKKGDFGIAMEMRRDVRIYAGNYKTWYAQQVEYGRGGWKGGAHPFLRPALNENKENIRSILENG